MSGFQMVSHYFWHLWTKTIQKPDENVRFSNGVDPNHSKTKPFMNRTHLDHLKTGLVRYSDGYCNQKHWAKIMGMIIFNFLSQFLELLSSIGFVPEGVSCRKLDRIARNGNGDAVERASGPDLNCNNLVSPLMTSALTDIFTLFKDNSCHQFLQYFIP